jgi:hypothetical protein
MSILRTIRRSRAKLIAPLVDAIYDLEMHQARAARREKVARWTLACAVVCVAVTLFTRTAL